MKGKVNCTCGWSWNKSDSSKKDMYICHECGRDNSNNMKNGGWLKNYQNGGDTDNEDYNMKRALELGYTADENGHWPSVDYETGEWLKSKKHHTRGMEMMAYELNPELRNKYNLIENEKGTLQYVDKKDFKNGGWLDSYADGGTMQEHQENYNDSSVSLPEGFVGMGNNTKGRNYSPAWGGQFQMGGQAPKRRGVRYNEDGSVSTHLMKTETDGKGNWFSFPTLFQNSIPYADDSENWLDMSDRPWEEAYKEAKKRGEVINFGSDKDAAIKFGQGSWKDKKQMGGNVYPVNYVPQAQGGMSMPGAVGFTYARTKGIPSNGPYAKKTMASAQNGQEMRYYQNGLDWKPKGMKNGGWLDGYKEGGIIKDDQDGYRNPKNRGKVVEIKGSTMGTDGYDDTLYVVPDVGEPRIVYANTGNHEFPGATKFREYPMAKNGLRQEQKGLVNLDNLLNFTNYNTKQPGGWLDTL